MKTIKISACGLQIELKTELCTALDGKETIVACNSCCVIMDSPDAIEKWKALPEDASICAETNPEPRTTMP